MPSHRFKRAAAVVRKRIDAARDGADSGYGSDASRDATLRAFDRLHHARNAPEVRGEPDLAAHADAVIAGLFAAWRYARKEGEQANQARRDAEIRGIEETIRARREQARDANPGLASYRAELARTFGS